MKTSTRASTLLVAALIASLYPCAVCAAPVPTVAMAAGQKSPSNVVPLRFSAVFSEPVTGFTAEDVILSRDAMVAVAEQVPYAGTTFEIKITAAPDDGPLCLSIPGGAAMGLDGSPSLPSAGTETCIVLDRDPPPPPPTLLEPADGAATSDLSPRFSWAAPADATGVAKYEVEIRGPKTRDYLTTRTTYTPTLGDQGTYTWRVNCLDGAGNVGSWTSWRSLVLDTGPPTSPLVESPSLATHTWTRAGSIQIVVAPAADLVSGIGGYIVVWDHGASTTPSGPTNREASWAGEAVTTPGDGEWWCHVSALDRAGNRGAPGHAGPFYIDRTPPALVGIVDSIRLPNDPGRLAATADWSAVRAVDALDPHPMVRFSIPSGSSLAIGRSDVVLTAEDHAGNTLVRNLSVWVFNTEPPVVHIGCPRERERLRLGEVRAPTWDVTSLAPIERIWMSGGSAAHLDTRTPGRHEFSVTAVDSTGLEATASVAYFVLYGERQLEIVRVRASATEEVVWTSSPPSSKETESPTFHSSEWIRIHCHVDAVLAESSESAPITFSLVRMDSSPTGTMSIERVGLLKPSGASYVIDIPLVVFRPGDYTLWIGFIDGSNETFSYRLVR